MLSDEKGIKSDDPRLANLWRSLTDRQTPMKFARPAGQEYEFPEELQTFR